MWSKGSVWSEIAPSYPELSGTHSIAWLLPLADDCPVISGCGYVTALLLLLFIFVCFIVIIM